MLKAIQKEVENLRIKVYSGLSTEDTDTALYEIEQMLFKAMDKQLTLTDVSQQSELLELVTEIANSNQVYSNTRHKLWAKKLISSNCG